jgi:hypothetical protein
MKRCSLFSQHCTEETARSLASSRILSNERDAEILLSPIASPLFSLPEFQPSRDVSAAPGLLISDRLIQRRVPSLAG